MKSLFQITHYGMAILILIAHVVLNAQNTPAPGSILSRSALDSDGRVYNYTALIPHCFNPTDLSKAWPLICVEQVEPGFRDAFYNIARDVPYIVIPYGREAFIKDLARDVHIDPFRIYQTGHSQGGHISLSKCWEHPDHFAAVVPEASDLKLPNQWFYHDCIKTLKNKPIRFVQGNFDGYLPGTLNVYETMLEAGCNVEQVLFYGAHNAWPFRDFDGFNNYILSFMKDKVLVPFPRTVSHSIEFAKASKYSRAYWVNGRLAENYPGDGLFGVNPVFQVTAEANNIIRIDSADALFSKFDFYLDSHLVDMNEPVTVVKGGQTLHQGDIPANGKVSVTMYNVYNKPATPTTKPAQVLAMHVGNNDEKVLWQRLDSIRCAVFGVCGEQPPVVNAVKNGGNGPAGELLMRVFPNPANKAATIHFAVPRSAQAVDVKVEIYNINGTMVRSLYSVPDISGSHKVVWDGLADTGLRATSGIYLVRCTAGGHVRTMNFTFIK
jgi:hypothetical protein